MDGDDDVGGAQATRLTIATLDGPLEREVTARDRTIIGAGHLASILHATLRVDELVGLGGAVEEPHAPPVGPKQLGLQVGEDQLLVDDVRAVVAQLRHVERHARALLAGRQDVVGLQRSREALRHGANVHALQAGAGDRVSRVGVDPGVAGAAASGEEKAEQANSEGAEEHGLESMREAARRNGRRACQGRCQRRPAPPVASSQSNLRQALATASSGS